MLSSTFLMAAPRSARPRLSSFRLLLKIGILRRFGTQVGYAPVTALVPAPPQIVSVAVFAFATQVADGVNRVLSGPDKKGRNQLVGGKQDPGESILEALLREAIEEVGPNVQLTLAHPQALVVFVKPGGEVLTRAPHPGEKVELKIFLRMNAEGEPVSTKEMPKPAFLTYEELISSPVRKAVAYAAQSFAQQGRWPQVIRPTGPVELNLVALDRCLMTRNVPADVRERILGTPQATLAA